MDTKMNLQERVQRGAELLDEKYGKWTDEIPTKLLNGTAAFRMNHPCNCILHHVYITKLYTEENLRYGAYCDALKELEIIVEDQEDINHGFDCDRSDPDYSRWESYWVEEIKARLEFPFCTER